MTIALAVIIVFGIQQAGGMGNVIANAQALPGYLNLTQGYNAAENAAGSFGALPIASTLAWGLGYFGMPHILLRFMAIEDDAKITLSRRIASIWVVIAMAVAIVIGVIGYSVSLTGAIPLFTSSAESETIIIAMSNLMSQNGVLFAIVAGVILAGILAATMSTADSQLLTAASAVSQNLAEEFFGIKLSEKKSMVLARGTVVVIALIAVVLAWDPNSSVFRVVSFAWAGFGGAFGALMLFSLFWKRTTKQGAIAGMIAGGAMVFIWKFGIAKLGGVWAIYELLPAFICSAVVIFVVSLLTPEPDKDVIRTFETYNQ